MQLNHLLYCAPLPDFKRRNLVLCSLILPPKGRSEQARSVPLTSSKVLSLDNKNEKKSFSEDFY